MLWHSDLGSSPTQVRLAFVTTLAILALLLTFSWALIAGSPLHIDERHHYVQVQLFYLGSWTIEPVLTTIPGYHLLMAAVAKIIGHLSPDYIRLFNALIGFGCIMLFAGLTRCIHGRHMKLRTAEFALLPILFPYFTLIYTDVLSLFMILSALYLMLLQRPGLAYTAAACSLLIRQDNLIWLLFLAFFDYRERNGPQISLRLAAEQLKRSWPAAAGAAALLIFAVINGGFALKHQEMHPLKITVGNIYFALLTLFFLSLPLAAYLAHDALHQLRSRRTLLYTTLILLLFFSTYTVDNPLNLYQFHLRNRVLALFASSADLKVVYAVLILYAFLFLRVLRLARDSFYALYPFAALSLSLAWLIETRYYIVPFTLLLLFRLEPPAAISVITVVIYLITSFFLVLGISGGFFML